MFWHLVSKNRVTTQLRLSRENKVESTQLSVWLTFASDRSVGYPVSYTKNIPECILWYVGERVHNIVTTDCLWVQVKPKFGEIDNTSSFAGGFLTISRRGHFTITKNMRSLVDAFARLSDKSIQRWSCLILPLSFRWSMLGTEYSSANLDWHKWV